MSLTEPSGQNELDKHGIHCVLEFPGFFVPVGQRIQS